MVTIKNRFTQAVIAEGKSYKQIFEKTKDLQGANLREANIKHIKAREVDFFNWRLMDIDI